MGIAYKPEIDGLRAIAVLCVVSYHAGLGPPAGFVGVDIFFVISGYLITRLLHQELQATGRIDFVDFYARRARRILPALMAVVLATLIASWALLPPAELRQVTEAAAASFVFSANVFFANAANGYFDPETHTNPLLHLWSIGVEEQFYLVWPVFLLLARKRPALALGLIAAGSLASAEVLLALGNDRAAFYQTPPRAWELAAGALIAMARVPVRPWVGPMGVVVALVACAVPLGKFPGTGALLAVVGAAMVIAAAHAGQRNRLLAARTMVAVGLMSYSLYLWHWPVMVLGDAMPAWLQLAVSFTLAATSYHLIEKPFRRKWARPARPTVGVAAVMLVALCCSTIALARQLPKPLEPLGTVMARLLPIYGMGCDDWHKSAALRPCSFGPADAPKTAVIIGDSVALQWFPAARKIFVGHGWRLVALTKSSCPMVAQPFYYDRIGATYTACEEWRRAAIEWIVAIRPDVVILGSANDYGFSQDQWARGTRAIVQQLSPASGNVVLIRSTPRLRPGGQDFYEDVHSAEISALRDLPNVAVVDMNPFVCPNMLCRRKSGDTLFFRDGRHVAPAFAESLSEELQQQMGLQL